MSSARTLPNKNRYEGEGMKSIKLTTAEGKVLELPVFEPTRGHGAFDVAPLCKELGLYAYDTGLGNTVVCDSEITYIDGEKGELYYRDYPIEDIANNKNFLEVCYLLLSGCFPSEEQYIEFDNSIRKRSFFT